MINPHHMPKKSRPSTTNPSPSPGPQLGAPLKPNYRWFKAALADRQISQRELARQLEMEPSGLNRRLRGYVRLQLADAAKIAKLLEVPVAEVLNNAGLPANSEVVTHGGKNVPIIGWVDKDFVLHEGAPKGSPKTVEAPPVPLAGLAAVRFVTAASEAAAFDGAIAYFRPGKDVPAEALGKMCVVTTGTGAVRVCVVRRGYARGRYNLAPPVGGRVDEGVIVEGAAPVVWLRL